MPRFASIASYDHFFNATDSGVEPEYKLVTMVFLQAAAPTGWTKTTTYDDYALRVVGGTVSTGGTVAFTTGSVDWSAIPGTGIQTITLSPVTFTDGANMASHTHSYSYTPTPSNWSGAAGSIPGLTPGQFQITAINYDVSAGSALSNKWPVTSDITTAGTVSPIGGQSHSHSIDAPTTASFGPVNLSVKYVDTIIAVKN
jgi:hypothetical protein